MNTLDRFFNRIEYEPNTGCWLWSGAVDKRGYGNLSRKGCSRAAHRASWEIHRGPIPLICGDQRMCVCHHCDTPPCVNPDHLFLGTHVENMLDRERKKRSTNGRKTHCLKGHSLSGSNLRKDSAGRRVCRACANDRGRAYLRRRLAGVSA
jgi:hypothetical protein